MSFGNPNNPYGNQPQPQPGYGYPQAPGMVPGGNGYPGVPLPGNAEIATMGRRFAARVLDWVLIGIVYGILLGVGVAGAVGTVKDAQQNCDPNSASYQQCLTDNLTNNGGGSSIIATFVTAFVIFGIITLLYEWLMVSFVGATLGKLMVGLRVVKEETGEKPGIGGGFIRWIIPTLGGIVCGIGQLVVYLSPFWDSSDRRRGWHDRAAGTMVIKLNP